MTDYLEPELLPQTNSALIRFDNKVELHGPESLTTGMFHRMDTHHTRHALSGRRGRGHITAVRNVRTAAPLICSQVISTHYRTTAFRDKDFMILREPVCK